jgi:hypothetical protein
MLLFAPLLLSSLAFFAPAVAPVTEHSALEAPTRHIRTTDPGIRALLKRGFRHSAAFAALVARLQQSDVYVYVEQVDRLPGALDGRTMMQPVANGNRYVRIQIALRGAVEDAAAVLGHELQHAVEIADAPDVRDQIGMTRLYERIGVRGGLHVYDTAAAQEMGRLVRRELSS